MSKKTRFMVQLSPTSLANLRDEATIKEISVGELVRRAVDAYVETPPVAPDPKEQELVTQLQALREKLLLLEKRLRRVKAAPNN